MTDSWATDCGQLAIDELSAAQAAELDFRTSFPGADALPDLDAELPHDAPSDGVEFARMLLAHDEQQRERQLEHEDEREQDEDEDEEHEHEREPKRERAARSRAAVHHQQQEEDGERERRDEERSEGDDGSDGAPSRKRELSQAVARARAYAEATDEDAAAAVAAAGEVVLHLSAAMDADDGTDPGADEGVFAVDPKDRCRYYGKNRARCPRAATGFDGRCAIHKHSQFCKQPRCSKFNQGNGYCIKHGGGKKCKHEGCEKQVQGYGYCSGHGGKPLCPMPGCDNKRMEGGYASSRRPPARKKVADAVAWQVLQGAWWWALLPVRRMSETRYRRRLLHRSRRWQEVQGEGLCEGRPWWRILQTARWR